MQRLPGHSGLFVMPTADAMPYPPTELRFPLYMLGASYGRAEREEAAARLITICQAANQWCGVSLSTIRSQVEQDVERYHAHIEAVNAAQRHNWNEQNRYNRRMPRYIGLCILTLGLYALFGKKPSEIQPAFIEIPEAELPFSLTYMMGMFAIMVGLQELAQQGLIQITPIDDEDFVITPTPALLEPLDRYRVN